MVSVAFNLACAVTRMIERTANQGACSRFAVIAIFGTCFYLRMRGWQILQSDQVRFDVII